MKRFLGVAALLIVGAAIGSLVTLVKYPQLSGYLGPLSGYLGPLKAVQENESSAVEKKPLYWVAPMDPNYRRDKPGKSPMGMDLVPFYEDDDSGSEAGPGTVRISPDVVNNLGVRTAQAKIDSLRSEIQTVGYVRYDEDQLIHIHPRVNGWIEKLYIKASGDPVKKGQPL